MEYAGGKVGPPVNHDLRSWNAQTVWWFVRAELPGFTPCPLAVTSIHVGIGSRGILGHHLVLDQEKTCFGGKQWDLRATASELFKGFTESGEGPLDAEDHDPSLTIAVPGFGGFHRRRRLLLWQRGQKSFDGQDDWKWTFSGFWQIDIELLKRDVGGRIRHIHPFPLGRLGGLWSGRGSGLRRVRDRRFRRGCAAAGGGQQKRSGRDQEQSGYAPHVFLP